MATRKSDLCRIIDEQQAKISKYEQKLRDVIKAYKSLAAEKSALEETVKALNANEETTEEGKENDHKEGYNNELENEQKGQSELDSCEGASVASSVDVFSETTAGEVPVKTSADGGSKIAVLRRALATITEEKSRQEKAFTDDRKNLLQEIAALKEEIKEREAAAESSNSSSKQEIQELKSSLRHLQLERDCDQADHAAMLKELQQKMSEQRSECEICKKEISALSAEVKSREDELAEGRKLIEQLLDENARLKGQLDDTERKLSEMPQAAHVQAQFDGMKAQHAAAIREEQTRSSDAMKELSQCKEENEQRVASLETKISDLTTMLADYERLRRRDLDVIDKLTTRVNELDMENTTLAKVTSCRNCTVPPKEEPTETIVEKVKKLCIELRSRLETQQTGHVINLYDVCGLESPTSSDVHSKCQAQYKSMKEEYDKYKLRAQTALKNRSIMKDTDKEDRHEMDQLRKIISGLQLSLSDYQRKCEESESTCVRLRQSIGHLKEEHKRELVNSENEMKQRISDLEIELFKQRERAVEMLSEKEKELETTRAILRAIRASSPYVSQPENALENVGSSRKQSALEFRKNSANYHPESGAVINADRRGSLESMNSVNDQSISGVAETRDPSSLPTGIPNLHLVQELARREKLVDTLRRDIRQLENRQRDLEREVLTKELQHCDTIEKLKEEIRSLESKLWRCQLNGENFEYLKNVLLQYMTCDDPTGKSHMLKAISRALSFSAKELETVHKHNARVWWPAGGKTK